MRILVTGGAGFIGSHLVDKLVKEGHIVAVIDDCSGGNEEYVKNAHYFYKIDLRNAYQTRKVMGDIKPEIVYHLAANAAENKAQFSPIDITSRNYDAFIKVLTPFIKYGGKRFIFTSSIAVYGSLQTPFKETDKPEPEDLYGISKLAAEQTLKVMSKVHGFEYVIARPHNVYGPRQNMRDPYRNVVTIWMNALLRNSPITLYGFGEQVRQFTYIDDLIFQLYNCGFEDVANLTFNVGNNTPVTLKHLLRMIELVSGKTVNIDNLPLRPQEVKEAVADHSLADHLLGKQETDFETALINTWRWCKAQGPQEPIYTEIEIPSDKLPQNWKR